MGTFANPESASRLLRSKFYELNGRRIEVKLAVPREKIRKGRDDANGLGSDGAGFMPMLGNEGSDLLMPKGLPRYGSMQNQMGLRNAGVGGWGFMPPPHQPFDPSKMGMPGPMMPYMGFATPSAPGMVPPGSSMPASMTPGGIAMQGGHMLSLEQSTCLNSQGHMLPGGMSMSTHSPGLFHTGVPGDDGPSAAPDTITPEL